jgi:unsaturated chondroitin disaccharide hydrolase
MGASVVCLSLLLISHVVIATDVMKYAFDQYSIVYFQFRTLSRAYYPYHGIPSSPIWEYTTATEGWTSGFTPGVFWNLYEYNISQPAFQRAYDVTEPTAAFANRTDTDDVSFAIMCGFGNGYRLMKYPSYLDVILTGARSLATRYSPTVRCTRSWNSKVGFLVNIDNMMDLEILFEANKHTNNQTWYNMAWQHANRTMYEDFREDNSTFQFVEYNETDGSVVRKYTVQGR